MKGMTVRMSGALVADGSHEEEEVWECDRCGVGVWYTVMGV